MKKIDKPFSFCFSIFVFFVMVFLHGLTSSASLADPLQEIRESFPDTITIKETGRKSIEFCPDNTCDMFVAKKKVSVDVMKDFSYLYIYFFSDYYALEDWRKSKRAFFIADKILKKPDYQLCKNGDQRQMARCLLRYLCKKSQIEVYAVRYDENIRSTEKKNIESVIGSDKNCLWDKDKRYLK